MEAPRSAGHPSQRSPRRAYVETYGCQMNVSDGELMQGILAAQGYTVVDSPEQADVVLVNTCAIREHAEQRVLGRVGELNRLKRERPDLILGVTGCMAQRMGRTLLERAPYVDLVMGPDGYRHLPEVLGRLRAGAAGLGGAAEGRGDAVGAAGSLTTVQTDRDIVGAAAAERSRRALPVLGGQATGTRAGVGAAAGTAGAAAHAAGGAAPGASEHASYQEADGSDGDRLAVLAFEPDENYEGLEVKRTSRVSAWIPVQRGCNHRCTFCIVPYVRGPEKNRDPVRILDEVRAVAASGLTEVVLLGQTVNSWSYGDWTFARLLREVARVDGIRRVRFTSPHPGDVTPELVETMATEPAICRQLHLPVQAGHDRTLKRMLRRYTVRQYLDIVRLVREAMPDIALSTDIIVAFPGETDDEYEATLDLVRTVRFDDAYLYRYSPRDGTPATRLPADEFLPDTVARARLERLIELQRAIQLEIQTAELGREVEVLVEREARSASDVLGRTGTGKAVVFPGEPALIGRYVNVRLVSTTGATFRAVPTGPRDRVGRVA